jgi:DNA-binding transcriptional MerR regulator
MTGRPYLSIGDVLTLLRQEFPDVTISKIRFLESQGLVNPERTPSGYRKFYEPDVERLRWVLRQQREHFLPLKVIKGRLDEGGNGNAHEEPHSHPSAARTGYGPRAVAPAPAAVGAAGGERLPGMEAVTPVAAAEGARPSRAASARAAAGRGPLTGAPASGATEPAGAAGTAGSTGAETDTAGAGVAGGPSGGRGRSGPSPAPRAEGGGAGRGRPDGHRAPAAVVLAEGDMTAEDMASASGCPPVVLQGLESFGLIESRQVGGVAYFGEEALEVARLAAAFWAFGVEPRHLRLHKHAAEREAGLVGQVVLPLLKQRNPESRQRAHDTVAELSRLGQDLRAVLIQRALRDQLGG